MSEQLILLYSKFSPSCGPILEFLRREDISNIHTLCIDNKHIRAKILNSKMDIKSVPCFLMLRDGRVASKFEGQEAHMWFESFTNVLLRSRMPPPPPVPQQAAPIHTAVPPPPPPAPVPQQVAVAPQGPPPKTPVMQPPVPATPSRPSNRTPHFVDLHADNTYLPEFEEEGEEDEGMTEDEIMSEHERTTVGRTIANDEGGRKQLKFEMSMRQDPHRMQEQENMENMMNKKESLSVKKKLRGPVQNEPIYTDTNFSGRDMIEDHSTARRSTSGNKAEEVKSMAAEMLRDREQFDFQFENSTPRT